MTTASTTYERPATPAPSRQRLLREVVIGAAVLDGTLGIFCLAAAGHLADWLSLRTGTVEGAAAAFLLAAVVGVWTAARGARDVRAIGAANDVFAIYCLAAIGFDSPNALGVVLLVGSALAALATAIAEWRIAR